LLSSRGFPDNVCLLAEKLIPITRILWFTTKSKMMPTPGKNHYYLPASKAGG